MSVTRSAVKHPTTVLIIFILLTALGGYLMGKLPIDLLPDMDIPYVLVQSTYTDASPTEVEDKLTRVLENSLSSVSGLKQISSTSSQGSSTIIMEFEMDADIDQAVNSIRDRIDLVRNYLPSGSTSPVIVRMDPTMIPIMTLALTSDTLGPEELRTIAADTVQPRLEQVSGVASTSLTGGRERAIRVTIPQEKLDAYHLSLTSISQMLAAQNLQSSAGQITEDGITWSVTTDGQFASLDDIRSTVIAYKTGSDNTVSRILLGDVATVTDGYKDVDSYAYFNGKPAVNISLQKQTGKNTVATAEAVRSQLDVIRKSLPAGVEITEAYNTSDIIGTSVKQVEDSALQGALLAILVLLFFLRNFKSTLIIGLSIPISLVITLGVMYFAGFTLNLMTLAGLALGIGMLVDNSIVILENIFSYREKGAKAAVAAVLGSQEMVMAITSSTLTTICVFLPMILYKRQLGMVGQVFNSLAFTVVFSLVCSLLVALFLVPVLASKYLKIGDIKERNQKGFQKLMTRFFTAWDNGYAKAVRWTLHHKVLVILVILLLFGFSIKKIGDIGFIYMPSSEENSVTVSITMPQGTDLEVTDDLLRQFDAMAQSKLAGVKSSVASSGGATTLMSSGGSSTASVSYTLYDSAERKEEWDTDATAKAKLESLFPLFPQASFSIQQSTTSLSSSSGIDIAVKSSDMDRVVSTSNAIKTLLEKQATDSLADVTSSLSEGLPELSITYDRERMYALGVTIAQANAEIQSAIKGTTATLYHDKGSDIDVIVSLDPKDKTSIADLDNLYVTSSAGLRVPLSNFATYTQGTGPISIAHEDQSRVVHVTANIRPGHTVDKTQREIQALIDANIPQDSDVMITYSGDYQELQQGLTTFAEIIIMAILLVFAIMASQFESFKNPFIILFCIPLSVIGIVLIYLATGQTLSLITAVGLLLLVGIIVNNGIVLISYISMLRKRGESLEDACVDAAKSRLRPILMTTLTTLLALIPMAFTQQEGSAMVQPIGQTVLGGLGFGTLMTLFLMPVLYYIFNRHADKKAQKRMEKEYKDLSVRQEES
ncbi:MAG: efflux RND transporter permease subunit [Sphaerochaeta sp.]|jgi:HAE1 family hydrophobic/amphiphilic exporter-1|nr:efflux RND transporter permease subunit [Sphaerochaeta sp.]